MNSATTPTTLGRDRARWKKRARYLVSGLLIAFVMGRVDWTAVGPAMAGLGVLTWSIALAAYLASQVVSGYRWAGLAHALGLPGRLGRFVGLYFEGMFFNLVLPGSIGGDLIKACRLGTATSDRLLAGCSVLAERLCGLVALVFLAGLAFGYRTYHWSAWQLMIVASGVAAAGLAAIFAVLRGAARLRTYARDTWSTAPHGDRQRRGAVGATVRGVPASSDRPTRNPLLVDLSVYRDKPSVLVRGIGLGMVIQLLNILMFVVLGRAMGIEVPVADYFVVVPCVSLATALPLSIGGIGLREAGFATLLTTYGVDPSRGAALGLAGSSLVAGGALIGGVVHLLHVRRLTGRPIDRSASAGPVPTRGNVLADKVLPTCAHGNPITRPKTTRPHPAAALPGQGRWPAWPSDHRFDRSQPLQPSSHSKGIHAMSVSVVVPIYNEQDNIDLLYEGVHAVLSRLDRPYEIIFVDDGSLDRSADRLHDLVGRDPRVRVIRFRRNYGQTSAMAAGIQAASGDVIVTIDGDLQNDPADIPMLLAKLEEGYDLVHGWRKDRQDALINRRVPSKIANWLIAKVTRFPVHDLGCTLKAMRRETARDLKLYGEMHRFIPVLAHWQGARCAEVVTRHHARRFGETKYGIWRTFRVLLDLITVKYLVHYAPSPMKLFGGIGLFAIAAGLLSGMATVAMKLFGQIDMTGNPLLLLAVFAATVGIQFLVLGLLGEICSRIYYECLDKRLFSIRERLNFPSEGADAADQDSEATPPPPYHEAA